MLEHGAYTLLIHACYDRERFPTLEDAIDWCWARTKEEKDAVEFVLSKFFDLVDGVYIQNRIQEEIDKYHESKKNHWAEKLTKSQRCAIQANRNAAKIKATPSWLTISHKSQISEIYAQAAIKTAETGIPHEVDHIVPLRGFYVCGLHTPWNLQIIPAFKNRQKSNSMVEVM